jgi:PAS domain-containing protein
MGSYPLNGRRHIPAEAFTTDQSATDPVGNQQLRGHHFNSHPEEVRAFLASSREVMQRIASRVEVARTGLAVCRARVQAATSRADRFASQIEELRALGEVSTGWAQPIQARLRPSALSDDAIRAAEIDSDMREALLAISEALEIACEELRQGRRMLEREHAKHVDAFESESVPTLITDGRAAVREANRAAAVSLGVDQASLPGRLLVAFVARQDVDRFRTFASPLWDGLRDDVRSLTVRIRPRGRSVIRAKLSVRFVRSITRKNVGLRWTILPEEEQRASA